MTEEKKNENKNCSSKKSSMIAYALIQMGTRVVSAISLAAIALSFCSIQKESKVFNECVEEVRGNGKSYAQAVRFCNGGR